MAETPAAETPAGETPAGDTALPVYALLTQVFDAEGDRSVYVLLSNTLDVTDVSLDRTREFPGVANLAALDGKLMVSSGEGPVITAFQIGDDLSWTETGRIGFLSYGLDSANFFGQFTLDERTQYLPYERTKRIIWDPTAMQISGVREDSNVPFERNGLELDGGGNPDAVKYDGAVLQAFFYHDVDWNDFGADSLIARYDPLTHDEVDVLTAPCPGLQVATRDERGYTYFSTRDYPPARALFGVGPAPCVARATPEYQIDEGFTSDLSSWTDGRYAMNFRYFGNGLALANVLHSELLDVDFSGEFSFDAVDQIWATGPHWRLWLFDLDAETARPIEGLGDAIGYSAEVAALDGRTFLFVPNDVTTRVYELDADGAPRLHFEMTGAAFKWVRVR